MTPEAFLAELDHDVEEALARVGAATTKEPAGDAPPIAKLLATALKKELEAAEEAAMWVASEPDVEVKLALMRQCGDEARHYRLVEARLRELGVDVGAIDPRDGGPTPMLQYLRSLETTIERVAAGPFAREALARVLNGAFIELCESKGDAATAALYRDVIQPDEGFHHGLGRKLLARLATTDEARERARAAVKKTLAIAEELTEIARVKKGVSRAPGC